jgi:hypothetical protein
MPNINDPDQLRDKYVKLAKQHGENLHRIAADFKEATGKTLVVSDPTIVSNRDELASMMKVLTSDATHQIAVDTEVMRTGKPGTIQISVADGPHAEKTFTVLVNAFRQDSGDMSHLRSEINRAFSRDGCHQFYHNMAWDVGRLADDGFRIPLTNNKGEVTAHDTLALSRRMGSSKVGIKEDVGQDNSLVAVVLRKLGQYTPKKLSGVDLGPGQEFDYMEEVSKSGNMNPWFLRYGATDALSLARLVSRFYKADGAINDAHISTSGPITKEQLEKLEEINTSNHVKKLIHRPPPGIHTMLTQENRNTTRVVEENGQLFAKSYIHDDDIDRGVLADIISPDKIRERREQLERQELSKLGINIGAIPPERMRAHINKLARENPQARTALAKAMHLHMMEVTPKLTERGINLWSSNQALLQGTSSYNPLAGIRAAPKWVAREIGFKLGLFGTKAVGSEKGVPIRNAKGKTVPQLPSDFYTAIDLFRRGYSPMPSLYVERMKSLVPGGFTAENVDKSLAIAYNRIQRIPSVEEVITGFKAFGIPEEAIRADPERWSKDYHKYLIDNWMGLSEISKFVPRGGKGFSSLREIVTMAMGRFRHTKSNVPGFTKSQAYAERDNALRSGEGREILMDLAMPDIYKIPGLASFRAKKSASVIKYAVDAENADKIMDEKNAIMPFKDEYYDADSILRYTRLGKFDNSDDAKRKRLQDLNYDDDAIEKMIKEGGPTLMEALTSPVLYDKNVPWMESARIAVTDDVREYATNLYNRREGYSPEIQNLIEEAIQFDDKGNVIVGQKDTRKIGRKGRTNLTTGWYQGTMSSDIAGLVTKKIFRDEAFLQNIPRYNKSVYRVDKDASGKYVPNVAGLKNYLEDAFEYFTQPDILKNIPNKRVGVETAKQLISAINYEREYRSLNPGTEIISNAEILKLNEVFAKLLNQRVLPSQRSLKMQLQNAVEAVDTVPYEVEDITPGLEFGAKGSWDKGTYEQASQTGSTDRGRLRFKKGASQDEIAENLARYEEGFSSVHDIFLQGKNIDDYTRFIDSLTAEAAVPENVDTTVIQGLKSVAMKMINAEEPSVQDEAADLLDMPLADFYEKHIASDMYASIEQSINNARGVAAALKFRVMQPLEQEKRMMLTPDVFRVNDPDFIGNLIKSGSIPGNFDGRVYTLSTDELAIPGLEFGGGEAYDSKGNAMPVSGRTVTMGQTFNQKVTNALLGRWAVPLRQYAEQALADNRAAEKQRILDEKDILSGSSYIPITSQELKKDATIGRIPIQHKDGTPGTMENVFDTISDVRDPEYVGNKKVRGRKTKSRGHQKQHLEEKDFYVRYVNDIRSIVNQTTDIASRAGMRGPIQGTTLGVINRYLDLFGPGGMHEDIFGLDFTRYSISEDDTNYSEIGPTKRHIMAQAIDEALMGRDDAFEILDDMRNATVGWWESQGKRPKESPLIPNLPSMSGEKVPIDYDAPLGNSMYDWLSRADPTNDIKKTFLKSNPQGARALSMLREQILDKGMSVMDAVDWYKNKSSGGVPFENLVDMVKGYRSPTEQIPYSIPTKVYREVQAMKLLEGLEVGSDEYTAALEKMSSLDWDHLPGGMRVSNSDDELRMRPNALDNMNLDILEDMKEWKIHGQVPFTMPEGPAPLGNAPTTIGSVFGPAQLRDMSTTDQISDIMAWHEAEYIPDQSGIGEYVSLPNSKSYDFSGKIYMGPGVNAELGKTKSLVGNSTYGIKNWVDPYTRMWNVVQSGFAEKMAEFRRKSFRVVQDGNLVNPEDIAYSTLRIPQRKNGGFIHGSFIGAEGNAKETAWSAKTGKLMGVLSEEGMYHAKDPAIILSNQDSKKVLPHFFGGTDDALEILATLNDVDIAERNRLIESLVGRGATATSQQSGVYQAIGELDIAEQAHRATPRSIRPHGLIQRLFAGFSRNQVRRHPERMGLYDPSGNQIINQIIGSMVGTPEQMTELNYSGMTIPQGHQGAVNKQISDYRNLGRIIHDRTRRQMQLYDIHQRGGPGMNEAMANVYAGDMGSAIDRFEQTTTGMISGTKGTHLPGGVASHTALSFTKDVDPLRREIQSMIESLRTMGGDPNTIARLEGMTGQGGILSGDIHASKANSKAVSDEFAALSSVVSGELNPGLRTMSGLVNINNRAQARFASPEYRQALMKEGYIGNAVSRHLQNMTGGGLKGFLSAGFLGPIRTNEESTLEMQRRVLARQEFGDKAIRFLKGRPDRDVKDTLELSYGGQFGKESAEGQGLQAEIMAKAERFLEQNFSPVMGSRWRSMLKMQTGTVYDTSDTANKNSTLMSQLGINIKMDEDDAKKVFGSVKAAEKAFINEVVGDKGMTEKIGVSERQQFSVQRGQRSAKISAENSGLLSAASTFQGHGRRMTALSMGAMGTYFSITGMYSAINQGIRMITDSLKDLSGSMKSIALTDSFSDGMMKADDIMKSMNVSQGDFVTGWKRITSLGSALQVFLGSIAVSIMKDDKVFSQIATKLIDGFKAVDTTKLVKSIQSLLNAAVQLVPVFMDLITGLAEFFGTLAQNRLLTQLIVQFTILAFVLQPFLTIVATMIEGFALLLTIMGYGIPTMSLASKGMISLGTGTAFASSSVWALNGALMTSLSIVAVALVAWQALGMALDHFMNIKIPTPVSIGMGAFNMITGGSSTPLEDNCSGGIIKGYPDGGSIEKTSIGGFLKSLIAPGDNMLVSARDDEFIMNPRATRNNLGLLNFLNLTAHTDGGPVMLPSGVPDSVRAASEFSSGNKMAALTDVTNKGADGSVKAGKVLDAASGGSYLNVKLYGQDDQWKGKGDETTPSGFEPLSWFNDFLQDIGKGTKNVDAGNVVGGGAAGALAAPVLGDVWDILKGLGKWIWDGVTDVLGKAWNAIKGIGEWIWNGLKDILGKIWEKLNLPDLSNFWEGLKTKIRGIWDNLNLPDLSTFWEGLKTKMMELITGKKIEQPNIEWIGRDETIRNQWTNIDTSNEEGKGKGKGKSSWSYGDEYGMPEEKSVEPKRSSGDIYEIGEDGKSRKASKGKGVQPGGFSTEKPPTVLESAKGGAKGGALWGAIFSGIDEMFVKDKSFGEALPTMGLTAGVGGLLGAGMAVAPIIGGGVSMLGHDWMTEFTANVAGKITGGEYNEETGKVEGGNKTAMDIAGMAGATFNDVSGWALTGATIGSVVPGAGTLVGGAVGAGVGLTVGGIQDLFRIVDESRSMREAGDTGHLEGQYGLIGSGIATAYNLGTDVREGRGIPGAIAGAGAATGEALTAAMNATASGITAAGLTISGAITGFATTITTGVASIGPTLMGIGSTILEGVKNGLAGLNDIGSSIREIILGMIKGIPVVGEAASTVVGAITDPVGTIGKIVGAADGGLMTKDGLVNAHAGELIGPLSSLSSILSTNSTNTITSTNGSNVGGNTYTISVPITIHGNADKNTAGDIKRELEVLLPRLLKSYDMGSLGI